MYFENSQCVIYDPFGQKILRVKMRSKSFSFDPIEEEVAYCNDSNAAEIWHKRLGHCRLKRMLRMKKTEMARSLPQFADHLPNCAAC